MPVILDGAQSAGAIPVDVVKLRCAAYAAAGQKWLCGADGTGMLYVAPEFRERVRAIAPGYTGFADASLGLESELKADARRYDTPALAREVVAFSVASLGVLRGAGMADVLAAGPALAAGLAERLEAHGRAVAPRGHTTLAAFEDPDPEATRDRLARAGHRRPQPPGHPVHPRLGRRVVEPGRPRAPARGALDLARLGIDAQRRAAAVDRHDGAVDEARCRRQQVRDDLGDLRAVPGAAERVQPRQRGVRLAS